MQLTDKKHVTKDFPLYVCTRKGCHGHGFDTGHGRPKRNCDHPRIGVGTLAKILFTPVKWIAIIITFGEAFKHGCGCETREKKWNQLGFWSPFYRKKLLPWENIIYKDRIA